MAADELHDEEDLGLGGHDLKKLHDFRVADVEEDGDLSLDVGNEATGRPGAEAHMRLGVHSPPKKFQSL